MFFKIRPDVLPGRNESNQNENPNIGFENSVLGVKNPI